MDLRESIPISGSASYYMHPGTAESPGMNALSNAAMHFQSNPGSSFTVPTLPMDASSTMLAHAVTGPPSAMSEPVRRKRGRPRKYGHDGSVSLALTTSLSKPTPTRPAQKWRGRPPGSARRQQPPSPGGSGSPLSGTGTMAPHILNVNAGEDIKRKILALLPGRKAIVLLSAVGSISAANIRASSSGGSITYEGHFDMVSLSGSYMNDSDGLTGGLNVTFAGPDGRLIGGPVEAVLTAATLVQVIVGILTPSAKPKAKASDELQGSGDYDGTFGNTAVNQQQPSQNPVPWQSSR